MAHPLGGMLAGEEFAMTGGICADTDITREDIVTIDPNSIDKGSTL
jgi:hypothetical protein